MNRDGLFTDLVFLAGIILVLLFVFDVAPSFMRELNNKTIEVKKEILLNRIEEAKSICGNDWELCLKLLYE